MTAQTVETINYRVHPAADIFPLIEGPDFDALVEDIREHGQMEPVVLDAEGRLIDGRNRARACQVLGIDVKETRYTGDDVATFVVSHNLHRRHLTDSQRAMIAARLANLKVGDFHGNQWSTPDEGHHGDSLTRSEAKRLLNVSEGSLHRAKVVERSGTPELVALTAEGKIPLTSAARVAEAEPAEQEKFVKAVREGAEPSKASQGIGKSAPPKSRPAPVSKSTTTTRDQRADLIADLAAQGYSSRQMPGKVGVSEETVRQIARDYDIEIPADKVIGRTRRIDSDRIVEAIVADLEATKASIDLVDYSALDVDRAWQWANSLDESLKVLNRFRKQIKELTQ